MSHTPTTPIEPTHFVTFVDDEHDFVGALYDLLCEEFGRDDVAAFADPLDADAWLSQQRPCVLVADVRMPRMSGIELVTRARERWPTLPVIITTAYPSDVTDKLLNERAFHYLPKPFSFESLVRLLCSIRDDERQPASRSPSIEVVEVLSLYSMAGYAGSLTGTATGWPSARIWLREGSVQHAQCGHLEGLDAVAALLAMPSGAYDWLGDPAPATTINLPLGEVLDACTLILESGRLHFPPTGRIDEQRARDPLSGAHPHAMPSGGGSAPPFVSLPSENHLPGPPLGDDAVVLRITGDFAALPSNETNMANNISEILKDLVAIDGFVAVAVADSNSGLTLGKMGGGPSFNVDMAAASNTEVVKAKLRAMKALKLEDKIEDILITLGTQYHLIRPLSDRPEVFLYLAVERSRANLAIARYALAEAEGRMVL